MSLEVNNTKHLSWDIKEYKTHVMGRKKIQNTCHWKYRIQNKTPVIATKKYKTPVIGSKEYKTPVIGSKEYKTPVIHSKQNKYQIVMFFHHYHDKL